MMPISAQDRMDAHDLAREKEELLALLLAEGSVASDHDDVICPRSSFDSAPLSFAQQRLWFLEQLGIQPGAYNMPLHLEFTGQLDIAALERAISEICRRHEALRTCFRESDGEVYQHICPSERINISVVNLEELAAADRATAARQLANEETAVPFDLTQGPMLRARLLRMSEQQHILLLTIHHIAGDGWSVAVFMRELSGLYAAFSEGLSSPLVPLPIQYADYATWQRRKMDDEYLAPRLDFWRGKLSGVPVLNLPTDRPRPKVEPLESASHMFELPADLAAGVLALAVRHDATPYMFLLAVFQVLLHRYTGQSIVAVGSPVANRDRREIEQLIGFFVNSLVVATDLSGDPSFIDVIARVRSGVLDAFAHQDVPFERIVEDLQPERKLNQHPLFQIAFAMQQREAMLPRASLPGLEISRWAGAEVTVRFDIELHMWVENQRLFGICMYEPALFDASTIDRFIGHFRSLLSGVVTNPRQRISELPLLSERERQQACILWNDTARPAVRGCFPAAFEAQVKCTPDDIAAVFESHFITYRELNRKANRLAHHLRALGVGPEVTCGLWMNRSLDLLVAILAVLKAGGAYVPVDPSNPRTRIAFVLRDARVKVLITRLEDLQSESELDPSIAVVALNRDRELIAARPGSNMAACALEQNLAYVLYTSGSTGQPKGVMIDHRALTHYLAWCRESYGLDAGSGTLVHSSVAFDLTVTSLFAPLLSGKPVVLLNESHGVEELELALEREPDLTFLKVTPAHLEVLGARLSPRAARAAHSLIVGGEALASSTLDFWRTHAPRTRVINEYGPTEATVGCSVFSASAGDLAPGDVPIGRPISNMELYVLNPSLELAPALVSGELHLAGDGLARGYLRQPRLTAASFVPNPFSAVPGMRLYKSGDAARWRVDGTIEFIGRLDNQMKVRGYRVELGEIEGALARHEAVNSAIVIARKDSRGEPRLSAYVIPAMDSAAIAEIRASAASRQVATWQAVFDQHSYQQESPGADPFFNTVGWLSSYDRKPIPEPQMREWAADIVGQVRALRPKRVLEIGCGTGMLLFQIAPECDEYHGTDFSPQALDFVRAGLERHPLPQVTLSHLRADDLSGFAQQSFDAVILNSIVQYFPSVDYLLSVIESCLHILRPGGFLFLGDIRNYRLLDAFHASIQSAPPGFSPAKPQSQAGARVQNDTELAIDPEMFPALRTRFPDICRVDIRLQRGRAHNELTKYRYHAVLQTGPVSEFAPTAQPIWRDGRGLRADDIRNYLQDNRPVTAAWSGISNARLRADHLAITNSDTAGASDACVDPDSLYVLAAELGYRAEICWSLASPWTFDTLFTREAHAPASTPLSASTQIPRPWIRYANDPVKSEIFGQFARDLHAHARLVLPAYMAPDSITVLEAFPLTLNGKVNREALPPPDASARDLKLEDNAEQSVLIRDLSAVFAQTLGRDGVGPNDSFFTLGGHSLLAYRLMSAIRDVLHVQVPLHVIFTHSSVAALAAWVGERTASPHTAAPLPDYVIPLQPSGTKKPLFFFPPAVGISACYAAMAEAMEPGRPLYGFLSPGILDASEPLRDIEKMAALYADAIIAIEPDGPHHLCGWSFGAILACAVASELEHRGRKVGFLALLDGGWRDASLMTGKQKLAELFTLFPKMVSAVWDVRPLSYTGLRSIGQWVGVSLPASASGLFRRNPASQARLVSGIAAGSWRALRVAFANTRAGLAYLPGPFSGRAVLFRTKLHQRQHFDPLIAGVRRFAAGGIDIHPAPGSHMTLVLDPDNARDVGKQIDECLSRSENAPLSGASLPITAKTTRNIAL